VPVQGRIPNVTANLKNCSGSTVTKTKECPDEIPTVSTGSSRSGTVCPHRHDQHRIGLSVPPHSHTGEGSQTHEVGGKKPGPQIMVPEGEKQPGRGMVGLEDRQEQVGQVQEGRPALGMHREGKALPLRCAISTHTFSCQIDMHDALKRHWVPKLKVYQHAGKIV
jgi:hypothetical protein